MAQNWTDLGNGWSISPPRWTKEENGKIVTYERNLETNEWEFLCDGYPND